MDLQKVNRFYNMLTELHSVSKTGISKNEFNKHYATNSKLFNIVNAKTAIINNFMVEKGSKLHWRLNSVSIEDAKEVLPLCRPYRNIIIEYATLKYPEGFTHDDIQNLLNANSRSFSSALARLEREKVLISPKRGVYLYNINVQSSEPKNDKVNIKFKPSFAWNLTYRFDDKKNILFLPFCKIEII